MTIDKFIEKTLNVMGGIYEPLEYALCSAVIPDKYAECFNGKTDFLLAFDYEVAQENPGSEFVTYGSFIFEKFLEISRITPLVTHKYFNAARTDVADAENKIKRALNLGTIPAIIEEELGSAMFVCFNFNAKYISDETTERILTVWIDLLTGKTDEKISKIFISADNAFESDSDMLHFEPVSDISGAYKTAYEKAEIIAGQNSLIETDLRIIKSETERIIRYYDELISENKKRSERKGLTDERLKEISEKETALILEKNRQIEEITYKFTTKIEISIENAVVYHIPCRRFLCTAGKRSDDKFIIYYNFALKEFNSYSNAP